MELAQGRLFGGWDREHRSNACSSHASLVTGRPKAGRLRQTDQVVRGRDSSTLTRSRPRVCFLLRVKLQPSSPIDRVFASVMTSHSRKRNVVCIYKPRPIMSPVLSRGIISCSQTTSVEGAALASLFCQKSGRDFDASESKLKALASLFPFATFRLRTPLCSVLFTVSRLGNVGLI